MAKMKYWLWAIAVAAVAAGPARAEWLDEWEQKYLEDWEKPQTTNKDLATTVTIEGVSEYIWRGFDMLDDRGALQPSIEVDWWDTGFSMMVWSAIPVKEELGDKHEMRYIGAYSGVLWADMLHATKYSVNFIYYDFTELPSTERDAQEAGVQFSWPKAYMASDSRLVPSYYVGRFWPAKSNAANSDQGGWIHILGLDYEFWLFGMGVEKQIGYLSSELVYNDGLGGVDHDWSHVVFGVGTKMQFGQVRFEPKLRYQISFEESVNDEDELWGGASISYRF